MVVHSLKIIFSSCLLVGLLSFSAQACFGPKLFVGVGEGPQSEALYALVTLYVQEKTGVESTRVELEGGQNPLVLLASKKIDLAFILTNEAPGNTVFQIAGLPLLVTGARPQEELQFTTVLPALKKLNRLLKPADVDLLVSQIAAGESALSAARKFLMELRWI